MISITKEMLSEFDKIIREFETQIQINLNFKNRSKISNLKLDSFYLIVSHVFAR